MAGKTKKKGLTFNSIDDVKLILQASKESGAKLNQKEFMDALNDLDLDDSQINDLILWCQKNLSLIHI